MIIPGLLRTARSVGIVVFVTLTLGVAGCDKSAQSATKEPAPASDTASRASIKATIKLSPDLAKKAAPDDVVFIFARAAQGPRMPLAIVRKQVKDLPASVTLDDSMAMMPEMKLSSVPEVVVGARISKSGNASAQPGDLEGFSAPIKSTSETVDVVIANVVGDQPAMPPMSGGHPPMGGTEGASGFMHPQSSSGGTVNIPADVKAKWKAVNLSVAGSGGKEKTLRVAIGDKFAVDNLTVNVVAFVPAFMSDSGTVTSSSNDPKNPAVLLQLMDQQKKLTEGWVFKDMPTYNSFNSDKVKVRLLSAVTADAK